MTIPALYDSSKDFCRLLQSSGEGGDYRSGLKDVSRILHSPSFRKMQGKMQLYPLNQSELFRNRLTHSIEVAEIAVRIADKLNWQHDYFKNHPINSGIVQAAGLAHDIGHPPFGHAGEKILNMMMAKYGGFESNAQTLRILSQLEPRATSFDKNQLFFPHNPNKSVGLHLTYRTLASVVKYDRDINPAEVLENPGKTIKGIYPESRALVDKLKKNVIKGNVDKPLKTVECQIMDIADDIAYSTYDFEDSMIAGMVHPLELFSYPAGLRIEILNSVNKSFKKWGYDYILNFDDLTIICASIFDNYVETLNRHYSFSDPMHRLVFFSQTYQESIRTAKEPKLRRAMTEALIDTAINSIKVSIDSDNPELSNIRLGSRKLLEIETLKSFNYCVVTNSNKLRLLEKRVEKILSCVFEELFKDKTGCLLSPYIREQFALLRLSESDNLSQRARFVCDYISGMSEREVINIYEKLNSSDITNILGVE